MRFPDGPFHRAHPCLTRCLRGAGSAAQRRVRRDAWMYNRRWPEGHEFPALPPPEGRISHVHLKETK